jgi:phage shock protein E
MISRRTLLAAALLLTLVPAVPPAKDQSSDGTQAAGAGVKPGKVDGATARKLVASGVKVVDVRTPAEFATGHVPGAINIPHDQMAARHAEVGPPSTPVMLYCKSGRRTEVAMKALREKGFTAIYDLESYDRWAESEPKR